MKIICNKKEFLESILIALKCISNKSSDPILTGILIISKEDHIVMQSYNLDISVSVIINKNVKIIEKGSIIFNARLLRNIIAKFNNDSYIELNTQNDLAIVSCQETKFKISILTSEDFPTLPLIPKNNDFEIESYKFRSLISHTIFATSQSNDNSIYTGCLFTIGSENKYISCVAVDGCRIAVRNELIEKKDKFNDFIIPNNSLKEILYILDDSDEIVKLYTNNKHIMLNYKNITFTSRILSGNFLNYKNIFKNNKNNVITINRKLFIESILKVSLIINERNIQPIRLILKDDKLILQCETSIGTSHDEINYIDYKKNNIEINEIGCNPRYLIEALKIINDETVTIKIIDNISPILIESAVHNLDFHIILPVKLYND